MGDLGDWDIENIELRVEWLRAVVDKGKGQGAAPEGNYDIWRERWRPQFAGRSLRASYAGYRFRPDSKGCGVVVYLVQMISERPKIFVYITGDEQKI